MRAPSTPSLFFFAFCCVAIYPDAARSVTVSYQINETSSHIRVVPSTFGPDNSVVGGTRFVTTIGITQQSPGSLDSVLSGTLTADVTGSTFVFNRSIIDVLPNPARPFLPIIPGSPGVEDNFGSFAEFSIGGIIVPDGVMSFQDAMSELVSGTAVLGSPATNLQVKIHSGILNYQLNFPAVAAWMDLSADSQIVSNQSAAAFTGDVNGTIQIPFHLEFAYAIADPNTIDSLLVLDGEIVATHVPTSLPGDYNQNGNVDAGDYVLWRKHKGSNAAQADGDHNGTVGPEDYLIWRNNFGKQQTPGHGLSSTSAVPEPNDLLLAAIGLWGAAMRWGSRSRTFAAAS